jgi:peptidoglycan/LPS O-acetylase OafA/YrhL
VHQHLRRLTPLRFIAALFVVLFHFGQSVPPFNAAWIHPAIVHGNNAVSFFYCLSGFIMATVYQTPMNWFEKKEYWWARVARIYPVYLLCLAISAICIWQSTPTEVALSALLLQAWVPGYPLTLNAPGWSLSVEALFYLLFPFMAGALTRKRLRATAIGAVALWVATQFLTFYLIRFHYDGYPSKSHDFIFYFPLMHLSEFVLGAAAGAAYHLKKPGASPILLMCLGSVAAVALLFVAAPLVGLSAYPANGLYAPLFLAGIWLVASLPRIGLLEHHVAVTLGEASYAMYLLQFVVMYWIGGKLREVYPMGDTAHFYLCLAVLVAASLLVYFFFERPMRAIIKRAYGVMLNPRNKVKSILR